MNMSGTNSNMTTPPSYNNGVMRLPKRVYDDVHGSDLEVAGVQWERQTVIDWIAGLSHTAQERQDNNLGSAINSSTRPNGGNILGQLNGLLEHSATYMPPPSGYPNPSDGRTQPNGSLSPSSFSSSSYLDGSHSYSSYSNSMQIPKRDLAKYMTAWLRQNWTNPYPDEDGVAEMALMCGTTTSVINNWLINARTRKWRPAIIKATELNRPADVLLEDSLCIFDGKPVRPLMGCSGGCVNDGGSAAGTADHFYENRSTTSQSSDENTVPKRQRRL